MMFQGIIRVIMVSSTTLRSAMPINTSIPGTTIGPTMTKVYKNPVIVEGLSNLI